MAPLLSRLLVSRISPRRIMLPISSYVLLLLYLLFFLLLLLLRFLSQARPLTSALPTAAVIDTRSQTRVRQQDPIISESAFLSVPPVPSRPNLSKHLHRREEYSRSRLPRDPSLPREREERSPSRKSVLTRAASTYTSIYEVMKRIRSESRIFSSPLASLR